MEKDSPFKPSVAELAGRFKGHVIPAPASNEERLNRRRPPCSLRMGSPRPDSEEEESGKPAIMSPNPFRIKVKNSSIIEKLQANLALSPTALLPSPKSPEVKLQPTPLSPPTAAPLPPPAAAAAAAAAATATTTPPGTPLSPRLTHSQLSTEEEEPASFECPPGGAPLRSINKTRARLSFKRRPPTRQHRRSGAGLPCELYSPMKNGGEDTALDSLSEDQDRERERGVSPTNPPSLKDPAEGDWDCGGSQGDNGDAIGEEGPIAGQEDPAGARDSERQQPKEGSSDGEEEFSQDALQQGGLATA